MTSNGPRFIEYTPSDTNGGVSGEYIHYGLGTEANNGTWQTFTRDLEADLQAYEPGNELLAVNGFLIRGSGLVDDIELNSGEPVSDNTPPVISILGDDPLNLEVGDTFTDPGATAMDDVDGDVTASTQTSDNVDTSVIGTYSVTYTVSDTAGNSATETRRVNVTLPPPVTVMAINVGGDAYTSIDGTEYIADQYFNGGNTYTTTASISGTEDDYLYQSERYGNPTYAVPVDNGTYEVTIKFAEIFFDNSSEIDFDVVVEGVLAASKLNVWDQVAKNAAYDVTTTVTISDEELNINANNIKAIIINDN